MYFEKGMKFNHIRFTQSRDEGIFDVLLENEDILMNEDGIFAKIKKLK
ncbi:MAG: hypothetical protein JJT76_12315 [Clostridiaceae bacterium]|nr:hypothetical protein [Clostridiaceae bacterium]